MGCYYNQYHRKHTISWIFYQVNSKDGVDFAMLFTLRERPEDIRSGVVKGSQ